MTAIGYTDPTYETDEEPATSPFQALRVTYGMLLGVDDFETVVGYPRGKQMLHNAWLHGSGVVWGFPVRMKGRELQVGPGLALDGIGRELHLDADQCLDIESWIEARRDNAGAGRKKHEEEICAWLVASYRTCLAGSVPALADPCDLTRKHNDYSRFVETVHLELCEQPPTPVPKAFHRIRVLLGLEAGEIDHDECRQILDDAYGGAPDERAEKLLEAFRCLAALDVRDLGPQLEKPDDVPGLFPVPETQAGVVLAKVCVPPERKKGSGNKPVIDASIRTSLLPTRAIQELSCGLAPGLLTDAPGGDAGGPRVEPASWRWEGESTITFEVTGPLLEASVKGQSIIVTSLSDRGWVREDISRIRYSDSTLAVRVELHDPPAYDLIRLIVRGTGPTPVVGDNFIPLAGVLGGPPGTKQDGHDAVLTFDRSAGS